MPIWLASLGDKNVELTAEIADGWIPHLVYPERVDLVWGDALAAGKAKRSADLGPLQITAGGMLAIGGFPITLPERIISVIFASVLNSSRKSCPESGGIVLSSESGFGTPPRPLGPWQLMHPFRT